jgi:hypothetical protein
MGEVERRARGDFKHSISAQGMRRFGVIASQEMVGWRFRLEMVLFTSRQGSD